jgi:hypothetical protein
VYCRQISPTSKWCGHRHLSPDKSGNGIIEPFELIKAFPCLDVIPWARQRGLLVADIKGTWKRVVLEPESAPVLEGPDTRTAYLQGLLMRGGDVIGPLDGIVGKKTAAAIRAFQLASNLTRSGEFDAATVARLRVVFELKTAA